LCGDGNELRRSLGLVFGNGYTRVRCGLHRESRPEIDHAENLVDDLMGVAGACPPSRRLKVILRDGVNDNFSRSGIEFVPEFVDAAGVGFVGDHDERGDVFLPEGAADDFQFILGVDDRGIQYVDRFCGDALAAKNLVVEVGFAGVMNAEFGEFLRLRARAREPDLSGVTVAVKSSGFESARGKITAEHGDGAGLLQGILFDEPVADTQHECETGGECEKSESAEDGENSEQLADEVVGTV